jgi:hypothetical protein
MWAGVTLVESGAYMSIENILMLIFALGGLMFYAKDLKLGLIMHFILFSGLFMMFYALNWRWITPLIISLVFLVFISLTLIMVSNKADKAIV